LTDIKGEPMGIEAKKIASSVTSPCIHRSFENKTFDAEFNGNGGGRDKWPTLALRPLKI
jgi:hypothetical protein